MPWSVMCCFLLISFKSLGTSEREKAFADTIQTPLWSRTLHSFSQLVFDYRLVSIALWHIAM